MSTEITIGWTKYDPTREYVSFADGYRPGAPQHVETITVELSDELDGAAIAEAVFGATNDPEASPDDDTAQGRILAALVATGYRGEGAHWSLSVGDTVSVGDTTLACESMGWTEVPPNAS